MASNGAKTLLIFSYAGHGSFNGGYIALFDSDCKVNISEEFAELNRECANIWVTMLHDACALPQETGPRFPPQDFTGAAAKGKYKTTTISACRLG